MSSAWIGVYWLGWSGCTGIGTSRSIIITWNRGQPNSSP